MTDRKKPMYSQAKIYKLVNDVDDQVYIGSSCSDLSKRFWYHKRDSGVAPNRKVYQHLNQIGWDNVHIILVESYPCENKMELDKRERYWIETLQSTLNIVVPSRTKKEWNQTDKAKDWQKQRKQKPEYIEKKKEWDKIYASTDHAKQLLAQRRQTPEFKANKKISDMKYRAKKKAEKEALDAQNLNQ